MKRKFKSLKGLTAKTRFVALPAGSYSVRILDIAEVKSTDQFTVEGDVLVSAPPIEKERQFTEATPQLAMLAVICSGDFKDRKTTYRFPLVGYQKADGINDEERLAAGDENIDGYWVNEDGERYPDEQATKIALESLQEFIAAVCPDEKDATFETVLEALEEEEAKCNIRITADKYKGKRHNKWASFFRYDEDYAKDEESAKVLEDEEV